MGTPGTATAQHAPLHTALAVVRVGLLSFVLMGLPGGLIAAPASPSAPIAPTAGSPEEEDSDSRLVTWTLDIDAPEELRPLLLQYLDLARFQRHGDDRITRGELNRLVAATPAQTRSLLETEGYFRANVHVEATVDPGLGSQIDLGPLRRWLEQIDVINPLKQTRITPMRVDIRIDPGPRVQISAVDIEIHGPLAEAAAAEPPETEFRQTPEAEIPSARELIRRLRDRWALPVGQALIQTDWNDAKARSIALARAEGYASATWSRTEARLDGDRQQAQLHLVLDSGPLYRIGSVTINGLEHVDADSVQALLTFGVGDPLRERSQLDFQDRLVRTSLFETIGVSAPPAAAQPQSTQVRINLRERSLHQITLGLGVSDTAGPRVTLEHLHQRFAGQPWQGKSKLQVGRTERLISLDLTSYPVPGPFRNLLSGSLTQTEAGGLLVNSERIRAGRTQDGERIERLIYLEWQRAMTQPISTGQITDDTSSMTLNYQWVWRDLDHPILPTQGLSVSAEAGFGRSFHTETDSGYFGRSLIRLTSYWPLGKSWFSTARLQAGQVWAPMPTTVPYTLLFRAGGDDSVRGYGYQTLGPNATDGTSLGGRVLATTSVEAGRPFTRNTPAWWWVVFHDAGQAALDWRGFVPVHGYGLGVRWRSPVGPLRIDLAWGEETQRVRLHFNVGITF
jgi:translocation and assembly module TamA